MVIEIRKAEREDIDAMMALTRTTIQASYRAFLGAAAVEAFVGSGAADRCVDDHVEQSTVLLVDGAIAGYAVCTGNLIDLMMIDQPLQRRGFGTRLLKHCETALFQHYRELTLESFADNNQANRFYLENGWEEGARYFDRESEVDKIVFRKSGSNAADRQQQGQSGESA